MAYLFHAGKSVAIASAISLGLAAWVQAAPEPIPTEVAQGAPTTLPGDVLPDADIVTVASSIDDFSTLVQAIETAGLADDLMGDGPFTVFAPTNEAFADLDELLSDRYGIGVANLLEPANRGLLTEVLTYHVVPGAAVASGDIPNGVTMIDSLAGEPLQINRGGADINVNSVAVTAFDVPASNGVIHVVEHVLLPSEVVAALEETRTDTASATETAPSTQTETMMTPATPPAETPQPQPATTEPAPAEPVRGLW